MALPICPEPVHWGRSFRLFLIQRPLLGKFVAGPAEGRADSGEVFVGRQPSACIMCAALFERLGEDIKKPPAQRNEVREEEWNALRRFIAFLNKAASGHPSAMLIWNPAPWTVGALPKSGPSAAASIGKIRS